MAGNREWSVRPRAFLEQRRVCGMRPPLQGNVTKRGLRKATEAAKLDRPGESKLHAHDLRHGFASMLIREGADPVFVSRQLGHANPGITMRVYAHLFDSEAQADRMRSALEARFGSAGNAR